MERRKDLKKLVYGCTIMLFAIGTYLNRQYLENTHHKTLKVWVSQEEYEVLKTLNSIFEQQHGVVVQMEIVPSEQVLAKLTLQRGSADYPDIVNVSHTLITELVTQELISPSTDIFHELNVLPTVETAFKVMGDYYGVPYHAQTDLLFYDPLEFPGGLTTLAITENPEQFSLAINYQSLYHMLPFITGFGGYTIGLNNFENINFYDIGLNKPEAIAGLEHMIKLLDQSLIREPEADIYQAFINGSANILIAPSSMLRSLQEASGHVGFQAIPNFVSNEVPSTYMRIGTYQLTSDVKNRELALSYLRFLLSEEVSTARYEEYQAIAPINYDTIISAEAYHLGVKMQMHRSIPLPNQIEFNDLYKLYHQAANDFVTNPEYIQEILDHAVTEINQN